LTAHDIVIRGGGLIVGRLPQAQRSEQSKIEGAEIELNRVVEKRALQKQQQKLDNYLLDLTREQRERLATKHRLEWLNYHIRLAEAALDNGQRIAENHHEKAKALGWKPSSAEVNVCEG